MTEAMPDLARQRALVEAQRDELSRTIQVLADKVDVPARARDAAANARARLGDARRRYATPETALTAVAAFSALTSVIAFSTYLRHPNAHPEPR